MHSDNRVSIFGDCAYLSIYLFISKLILVIIRYNIGPLYIQSVYFSVFLNISIHIYCLFRYIQGVDTNAQKQNVQYQNTQNITPKNKKPKFP